MKEIILIKCGEIALKGLNRSGFEDRLVGATVSKKRVVLDGKILTAAGMGVALDMGLKIVEIFCGKEKASSLRSAVIAD